jgi:hypothetical protein
MLNYFNYCDFAGLKPGASRITSVAWFVIKQLDLIILKCSYFVWNFGGTTLYDSEICVRSVRYLGFIFLYNEVITHFGVISKFEV